MIADLCSQRCPTIFRCALSGLDPSLPPSEALSAVELAGFKKRAWSQLISPDPYYGFSEVSVHLLPDSATDTSITAVGRIRRKAILRTERGGPEALFPLTYVHALMPPVTASSIH